MENEATDPLERLQLFCEINRIKPSDCLLPYLIESKTSFDESKRILLMLKYHDNNYEWDLFTKIDRTDWMEWRNKQSNLHKDIVDCYRIYADNDKSTKLQYLTMKKNIHKKRLMLEKKRIEMLRLENMRNEMSNEATHPLKRLRLFCEINRIEPPSDCLLHYLIESKTSFDESKRILLMYDDHLRNFNSGLFGPASPTSKFTNWKRSKLDFPSTCRTG
jgi:hypothetical protein